MQYCYTKQVNDQAPKKSAHGSTSLPFPQELSSTNLEFQKSVQCMKQGIATRHCQAINLSLVNVAFFFILHLSFPASIANLNLLHIHPDLLFYACIQHWKFNHGQKSNQTLFKSFNYFNYLVLSDFRLGNLVLTLSLTSLQSQTRVGDSLSHKTQIGNCKDYSQVSIHYLLPQ